MQARALGDFLRSRRERVSPADVGLPTSTARRVRGLRREEVAVLAGIGVSWLVRLEQGAASGVSAGVLDAIADALALDAAERTHLHHLAGLGPRPAMPVESSDEDDGDGAMHRLVESVPDPAYVLDPRWRLASWNDALTALVPPLAGHGPGASFVDIFLTDPDVRRVIPDWEFQARRIVTQFRLHAAEFPGPETERVADALSAISPLFRDVWRAQDVDRFQTTTRSFVVDGTVVEFEQHRLAFSDRPGWTLTVFVPGAR